MLSRASFWIIFFYTCNRRLILVFKIFAKIYCISDYLYSIFRRQICDIYNEHIKFVIFISDIINITNKYYKCVTTLKLFYVCVTMSMVCNNHIAFYIIKNYNSVARSITKFHKEIEASKWNNRWRIRLLICIHKYIHVYCIYILYIISCYCVYYVYCYTYYYISYDCYEIDNFVC